MGKKIFNPLRVNLRLFDDGAAGDTGSGGGADTLAESSSQPGSDTVVYGVEGDAQQNTETGNQQTTNTGSNTPEQDISTPEGRAAAYKQFKEQFKDEFSRDFQGIFDKRFKTHKELEGRVGQYEPIVNTLMKYHKVNDVQALNKIIEDDLLADLAEQEGFTSIEKYKEHLEKTEKATAYDKLTQEQQQARENQAKIDSWVEQGLKLKETMPDFDLAAEIKNPDFMDALQKGLPVEKAYKLAHMDDLISKATQATAKATEEKVVQGIKAKAQRIPENGMNKTPGVIRKSDPSKLTDKDLEDIAERVSRGESIRF